MPQIRLQTTTPHTASRHSPLPRPHRHQQQRAMPHLLLSMAPLHALLPPLMTTRTPLDRIMQVKRTRTIALAVAHSRLRKPGRRMAPRQSIRNTKRNRLAQRVRLRQRVVVLHWRTASLKMSRWPRVELDLLLLIDRQEEVEKDV